MHGTFLRVATLAVVTSLVSMLVVGCSGGSAYSADEGQLFQRYLPSERRVQAHPDSLQDLTVRRVDDQVEYELDRPYQNLIEKWSVTCRFRCGRNYATLWSLELHLASLQAERDIMALRENRAMKMIDRARKANKDTLQIDVYWFYQSGKAAGPRYRAELHVQDSTYLPARRTYGPLRRAYVRGGVSTTYRRNRFYYPRVVDGTDILENATGVRLELYRVGLGKTRFVWRWDDGERDDGAGE